MIKTTITLESYLNIESTKPAAYGQYTVSIPGPFTTIDDMMLANIKQGGHYFDRGAKRFFRSKVYNQAFYGRFFIDSVQFESSSGYRAERQYKIRAVLDTGQTSSVVARDSNNVWTENFPTLDSAKRAIKRLVAGAL